jgi:hypothetical protein
VFSCDSDLPSPRFRFARVESFNYTFPVRRNCLRCRQTRKDAIFLRAVTFAWVARGFFAEGDFFIDHFSDVTETCR